MKLCVRTRLVSSCCCLLFAAASAGHASTAVDCDDPPGGRIICEDDQAAFCETRARKLVKGECQDLPVEDTKVAAAWVLTHLTGEETSPQDADLEVLKSLSDEGRVEKGGAVIRFRLPSEFLEELRKELAKPI